MKKNVFTLTIVISIAFTFLFSNCSKDDNNVIGYTELSGPYLGQTPPGITPEIFASGIISAPDRFEHSAAVFSPDLSEVYWSAKPDGDQYFHLYFMKLINDDWTTPQLVPFSQNYNMNRPAFSSDGNTLYYDDNGDIWSVNRQGDSWSEPTKLPEVINWGLETMHCITANGSLYFSRANVEGGLTDTSEEIHVSRKVNGSYTEPEKLDEHINSYFARELASYVAPDESYIIFEARNETAGTAGLFISYKMEDGTWSERIVIESVGSARFPSVSPDGEYLFFVRIESGIFWVNTSFIEDLKP